MTRKEMKMRSDVALMPEVLYHETVYWFSVKSSVSYELASSIFGKRTHFHGVKL
jgi:hypothetical protein